MTRSIRILQLAVLSISLLTLACTSREQETEDAAIVTKVTFGSCSRQDIDHQLWSEISSQTPDLFIWAGDNIYGDTEDMEVMKAKYDEQKNRASYQELLQTTNVIGVWDDHDYGVNDGGVEYPMKDQSKALMLDFLDAPTSDPRRTRTGAYGSYDYGDDLKVILLDTRYFRDPLKKGSVDGKWINVPADGTILGEEQWKWLEKELGSSTARINLIVSSIQVLAEEHVYEKWANFPKERDRLLNMIASSKAKGVLLLSGDRHIAEFSSQEVEGLPYPLIDFTASGLTHTWSDKEQTEPNQYRVGKLIRELNYGMLEFDWQPESVSVALSIRGHNGAVYETHSITYPDN